jgi:putative ABC transport system permease protein
MNWWNRLWRGKQMDVQLDKELRFHVEQQISELVARGVPLDEARRQANLEFGGPTQVAEECRDARGTRWLQDFAQDLRYGFRTLRNKPGFSFAAIATLALGIGASTAIFSAVNPVLFKPLPYPGASKIMTIWERVAEDSGRLPSFGTYHGVAERTHSFSSIAVMKTWQPTMTTTGEPERLQGQSVSADYFRVLGVAPFLGQDFNAADDRPHGTLVAILSYGLWQRRFAGDRSIIGSQITLDEDRFTVVGVMPQSFTNSLDPAAELWTLLQYDISQGRAWGHHLRMVGRLQAGVNRDQARHELDAALQSVGQIYSTGFATAGGPPQGVLVIPIQRALTESVRPALLAIFGAVLLVLVIACVNLTNLLLARGAQRQGEFAMRTALGASRRRLIRQLLTESLVLALLGGALGMLVAQIAIRGLLALSPADLPQISAIRVDAQVLVFAFAITSLIGLAVGLIPALQVSRNDLNAGLQHSSLRTAANRHWMRRSLVVAEIALALMLLVSAGLLFRSVERVFSVAPGFDASHLLTLQVQTSGHRFSDNGYTNQFFAQAQDAVRQLPGAGTAAFTSQLPLSGDYDVYGVKLEPLSNGKADRFPALRYAVTPGYLAAMRIPLRRGRLFDEHDHTATLPVALISESIARSQFGSRDPLGRRLRFGSEDIWYTIVGVMGDVKQTSLGTTETDAVYIPTTQWHWSDNTLSLVVRGQGDVAALAPAIRKAIWSVDKDQPIVRVATMESLLATSESQRQFALVLFECFALAALLLAAVGIYGVLSGGVTERMRELGIRSALGASRSSILAFVLRQGIALTALGVLIGLVGAFISSRALTTLLFGTSLLDPFTYLGVVLILVGVSIVACWLPAWRASRVDPCIILRAE